ncbi:MAG: 50S ribosomal protein L25 [Brevinematales bacterium]|jgi:large subunit ribosomal protein L25
MAQSDFVLEAAPRQKVGKADALKIRSTQRLPGVIYGPDIKENIYITVDYKVFEKTFKAYGRHAVFSIAIGGKNLRVIIKEYKIHPITRNFLHADFYAISPKKTFTTEIPMKYTGTPVGVKEGGGLYIFTRQVRINTDLENLPESIEVDISALKTNQYLIVRDIPKGKYKILTHEGTALVEVK